MTDTKRARWAHSQQRTVWAACGRRWDVVAISPADTGLAALTAMRAGTRRRHCVLTDHLRDVLYVMVPAGTGEACNGIPGVRVLSTGHQLLVPAAPDNGTAVADWVSHPREDDEIPVLVETERLAAHLRELVTPVAEKALS
ncbi:hypothetical protein [Streptomyces sp. AcH 505]|uniref:hypothetical protein n=1 Tax=Streptomyces sp. AcH 505 TaxID=352211 RepID=UPI001F528C66